MIARIPAYPGLPQPRAHGARSTLPVVLGVSVALHFGLFAWLAVQKFAAPAPEEEVAATPETTITLWNPRRPKRRRPSLHPSTRRSFPTGRRR